MRVKKGKTSYFYNDSAIQGDIKSITLNFNSGKPTEDGMLIVNVGETKMDAVKQDGASVTITNNKFTLQTEKTGIKWFNICHSATSGAVYLDSIDVVYIAA